MNKADNVSRGNRVRWTWQGSLVYGRVERVATSGTVTIEGNSFDATDDNPVVVVQEMKPNADGEWQSTGQQVARRLPSLTRIETYPNQKANRMNYAERRMLNMTDDEKTQAYRAYMDDSKMDDMDAMDDAMKMDAINAYVEKMMRQRMATMPDDMKGAAYRMFAQDHGMKADDMDDEMKATALRMYDDEKIKRRIEAEKLMMPAMVEIEYPDEATGVRALMKQIGEFMARFTGNTESATPPVSSFKAYGDYWVGEWTNNLEDREGEWFSAKAIRDYVKRVDVGLTPLPELWVWHEAGSRIGQAKEVAIVENNGVLIVSALGTFDDTPQALRAKSYYNKTSEQHGMSHGFTFPEGALRDQTYHAFNTFELSVLPMAQAANPYTSFENIKEITPVDEKKREHFEKVFGKEATDKIIAGMEQKASALSEIAAYKEFVSVDDATNEPPSTDTDDTATKALIGDLIGDQATLATAQVNIAKALKAMQETIEDLKATVNQTPRSVTNGDGEAVDHKDLQSALKEREAGKSSSMLDIFVGE